MVGFDYCAITGVDDMLGYAVAYHFLKSFQEDEAAADTRVKLFCQSRQGTEELENMGGEIVETSYGDKSRLEAELCGVQYLIFVPQVAENAIFLGTNVLHAAKDCSVDYVAMTSWIGADKAAGYDHLPGYQQMHCLERLMEQSYDKESYCIFRLPCLSEIFLFVSPMVEEQSKVRMPVHALRKFAILGASDIAKGIFRLSMEQASTSSLSAWAILPHVLGRQQRKNQTLFQITPSVTCQDPSQMACSMASGLGKGPGLSFEWIVPQEMREYLQRIREDSRLKQQLPSKDVFGLSPAHYLSDRSIQRMLEAWDMADRGHLDVVSPDLERALGRPPRDLAEFFHANRDNFRQLQ